MAYAIHAYAIGEDGEIRVKHIFYGRTEAEADEHFREHVKGCPMFGPADHDGRLRTFIEEGISLPTVASVEEEAEEIERDEN
jgi:hypothetical protein